MFARSLKPSKAIFPPRFLRFTAVIAGADSSLDSFWIVVDEDDEEIVFSL
jgi:hypothetical protein